MSGWNTPKLGAARIKVACVFCITVHLQALCGYYYLFFAFIFLT